MTEAPPSKDEGAAYVRLGVKAVSLLLVLQAVIVVLLWSLNPVGASAQASFALYLAAVMVSFSMVSYVVRVLKRDNKISRAPLLAGCVFVLLLLFAGLVQ